MSNIIDVTGGAGFFGCIFVMDWPAGSSASLVNLNSLICAGNLESLAPFNGDMRHAVMNGTSIKMPRL